jgi:N-acetylglutamate synthase-like GNAT family acetyltransferase
MTIRPIRSFSGNQISFTLRFAGPDDVPILTQLIQQSGRGLWRGAYDERQIESALLFIAGVDRQLIADQTYYVAELAGEIVGCGGWSRHRALHNTHTLAQADWLDPACEAAKIRAFFVHPAWARRGIGSGILNACVAAATAASFSKLEVLATLPGELLYASFGFRAVGRHDLELPDGVCIQTIKMEKAIGVS